MPEGTLKCPYCPLVVRAGNEYFDLHVQAERRLCAEKAASEFKVPANLVGDPDEDEMGPVPLDEFEPPRYIKTGAAI